MKTYVGIRTPTGVSVTVKNGRKRKLRQRLDLSNHSPSGFEWGYGGSGPAQLALALLADVLADDERALRLHQHFKFKVVGGLPHEGWSLTEPEIRAVIERIEREAAA